MRAPAHPSIRLLLVALRLADPETRHSGEERDCLRRWVAGRRCVVELGVSDGAGTAVLREAMAPDGVVYAVDPYPPGRLGFSAHRAIAHLDARRRPGPRPRWLELPAHEAADVLRVEGAEPDFVFSDALFTRNGLDEVWRRWRPLLADGAIWVQSTSRPVAGRTDDEHATVRWTREVLLTDRAFTEVDAAGTFTVVRHQRAST